VSIQEQIEPAGNLELAGTCDYEDSVVEVNSGEKVEGEWLDIRTKGKIRVRSIVELVQTKRKHVFIITNCGYCCYWPLRRPKL